MRRFFWITLFGVALASLGCVVPSLSPLFTDDDLVFDAQLVGPWIDDDETLWLFEESARDGYRLIIVSAEETSLFDAHLLELGAHRFLDLFPHADSGGDSFRGLHLVPAHTFYRVDGQGDSRRLVTLDPDWLEEAITSGVVDIAHAWVDGQLVLTASTSALQDLVQSVADDPGAFPSDNETSLLIDLRRTSI